MERVEIELFEEAWVCSSEAGGGGAGGGPQIQGGGGLRASHLPRGSQARLPCPPLCRAM